MDLNKKLHVHPKDSSNLIWGNRLREGDKIEEDDFYDGSSGTWEPAPCPGHIIAKGCETYWVRMR